MVTNMLDGIGVQLETDYLTNREIFDAAAKKVVYTGPVDAFWVFN